MPLPQLCTACEFHHAAQPIAGELTQPATLYAQQPIIVVDGLTGPRHAKVVCLRRCFWRSQRLLPGPPPDFSCLLSAAAKAAPRTTGAVDRIVHYRLQILVQKHATIGPQQRMAAGVVPRHTVAEG